MSQEDSLQKGLGELQGLFSNTWFENKPVWCTQISSWRLILHMKGQPPIPLQERQCHPRDEMKWEMRHLRGRAFSFQLRVRSSRELDHGKPLFSSIFHSRTHPLNSLNPSCSMSSSLLPFHSHTMLFFCFKLSATSAHTCSSLVQESKISSFLLHLLCFSLTSHLFSVTFFLSLVLPQACPGRQLAVWKVGGGTNKQFSSKNT